MHPLTWGSVLPPRARHASPPHSTLPPLSGVGFFCMPVCSVFRRIHSRRGGGGVERGGRCKSSHPGRCKHPHPPLHLPRPYAIQAVWFTHIVTSPVYVHRRPPS